MFYRRLPFPYSLFCPVAASICFSAIHNDIMKTIQINDNVKFKQTMNKDVCSLQSILLHISYNFPVKLVGNFPSNHICQHETQHYLCLLISLATASLVVSNYISNLDHIEDLFTLHSTQATFYLYGREKPFWELLPVRRRSQTSLLQ